MTVTIYHNPHCSKSRQTLALLEGRNITPQIIEYQKQIPTAAELERIASLLNTAVKNMMRKDDRLYQQLGLSDPSLTEQQLITAIIQNPVLLERPIVLANGKAVIGRPPESILDIL